MISRGADVAPAHFLKREVLGGGRRTCTDADQESGSKNKAIAQARYRSALDLAVKPVELFTPVPSHPRSVTPFKLAMKQNVDSFGGLRIRCRYCWVPTS